MNIHCPKCSQVIKEADTECSKCGIIFKKYEEHLNKLKEKKSESNLLSNGIYKDTIDWLNDKVIFWRAIHILIILYSFYRGYEGLSPTETANSNVDWIFIVITFITSTFSPLFLVAYCFWYSKKEYLQKPSWSRNPFRWWTDALQPLRLSSLSCVALVIGAAFMLPSADAKGTMTFYFFIALTIGLLLGEQVVYLVYKRRIVTADEFNEIQQAV